MTGAKETCWRTLRTLSSVLRNALVSFGLMSVMLSRLQATDSEPHRSHPIKKKTKTRREEILQVTMEVLQQIIKMSLRIIFQNVSISGKKTLHYKNALQLQCFYTFAFSPDDENASDSLRLLALFYMEKCCCVNMQFLIFHGYYPEFMC